MNAQQPHSLWIANTRRACTPQGVALLLERAIAKRFFEPRGMLSDCRLAVVAASRCGLVGPLALTQAHLGNALRIVGPLNEAEAAMQQALSLSHDCLPLDRARVLDLAATLKTHQGLPVVAAELLQESISIREACGGEGLIGTLINYAETYDSRGDVITALETVNEAACLADQANDGLHLLNAVHNAAEYLTVLGKPRLALDSLSRLDPLYVRFGSPTLFACREVVFAHIQRSLGVLRLAKIHYRQAIAAFRSLSHISKESAAVLELDAMLSHPSLR